MSLNTKIEWTDTTDNIIAVKGGGWWCRKISPGCAHCFAAKLNQNAFYGGNKLPYSGKVPDLILRRDIIDGWARQRKSKKHFVASMTDVFGDWVPQEWIDIMLAGMMLAERQTFQVLTKRPDVANLRIRDFLGRKGIDRLTANILIGTSVENQECADARIPHLLEIPAKVRFLSCEPLLGPVDLDSALGGTRWIGGQRGCHGAHRGIGTADCPREPHHHHDERCNKGLDWVICGGESGPDARPMHPDWPRSLRDQCAAAGVPFFFKQWGEWLPICCNPPGWKPSPESEEWHTGRKSVVLQRDGRIEHAFPEGAMTCICLGKKTSGRLLDGIEHSAFPPAGAS